LQYGGEVIIASKDSLGILGKISSDEPLYKNISPCLLGVENKLDCFAGERSVIIS